MPSRCRLLSILSGIRIDCGKAQTVSTVTASSGWASAMPELLMSFYQPQTPTPDTPLPLVFPAPILFGLEPNGSLGLIASIAADFGRLRMSCF